MPPKMSKSTDQAWAESFGAAISRPRLPQGSGWLTFAEVQDKYKLGQKRTYRMLKELIDKGLLQKYCGYLKKGNRLTLQVWYRPTALKSDKTR